MAKPGITEVENAFQPAKEVNSSERFAGRKSAVADAYFGLIAEGAHIAIVGNRGIGKTSLARQVLNISRGDNSLLNKLGLVNDRELDFLPVYFACGATVKNTTDLLERLLTSSSCLADWLYDIPKASKEIRGYTPKFGGNVFGIEASLGGEKKTELTAERALSAHSIDTVFTNALARISHKPAISGRNCR
jgi:AAA+ ATPase superfamily predicted ATPase